MQVASDLVDGKAPHLGLLVPLLPSLRAHRLQQRLLLIISEERRYHPHSQDVVHILQEAVLHHVGIREQKRSRNLDHITVHGLQILSDVLITVPSGQDDLEETEPGGEGGQLGKALLATAADPDQEGVAAGHANHSVEADHVGEGVDEQDKVHDFVLHVVLFQDSIHHTLHIIEAFQVLIHPQLRPRGLRRRQNLQRLLEIPENQGVRQRNVRHLAELLPDNRGKLRGTHKCFVVLGVEPVLVDAAALVAPQAHEHAARVDNLGVALPEALEDAGEVAEVEDVVELGRGRRQCVDHCLVEVVGRNWEFQGSLTNCLSKPAELHLQNTGENTNDGLNRWESDPHA
mmetsp:Transcript_85890/g.195813  ORF Transcript_85890/g.195813 Transcript_85890/m.195813 type:complete len:344 (-) Transcript_85890:1520-2551(-)